MTDLLHKHEGAAGTKVQCINIRLKLFIKTWSHEKSQCRLVSHHVQAATVHQCSELMQADLSGVQNALDLFQMPLGTSEVKQQNCTITTSLTWKISIAPLHACHSSCAIEMQSFMCDTFNKLSPLMFLHSHYSSSAKGTFDCRTWMFPQPQHISLCWYVKCKYALHYSQCQLSFVPLSTLCKDQRRTITAVLYWQRLLNA